MYLDGCKNIYLAHLIKTTNLQVLEHYNIVVNLQFFEPQSSKEEQLLQLP